MRSPTVATDTVAETLQAVRERTLKLIEDVHPDDLHRPLDRIMSPLVWDLGHIAAYEDLWAVHRLGGRSLLRPGHMRLYDAFETPRQARGDVPLLDHAESLEYLEKVRERTLDVLDHHGPSELHEMVLRHELMHTETMRQAMFLGCIGEGHPRHAPTYPATPQAIEVPAGPFAMGATSHGFAYDNERPRHEVDVPAFRISRAPITNASFLTFVEGGGYERREWWSDEGWAWKEEYDITHPLGWMGGDDRPVQHVSWFEADAFARSLGARLPTEAEWEKAATWDHGTMLEGVGYGWEWTSSPFAGYPGFVAHPYPEYSEVFFGQGHRVLRGGSWASARRYATATFRNWDLPQRRQIFSGIRVAWDVPR